MAHPRSWTRLRDVVGGRRERIRKAVLDGWPELGIPAFKDREIVGDRAIAEVIGRVQERATERVVEVVARSWSEDARSHLANLPKLGVAIKTLIDTLAEQIASASFVKYREVPDVDAQGNVRRSPSGQALTILKPFVDGTEIALAAQRLAGAMKDHAVLNKALLDSLAPFMSSEMDFSDAPPEVLAYLQQKYLGRKAA